MSDYIHPLCKQTQADLDALEAQAKKEGKKLKVEVIADNSGKFCGNALTFDTTKKAVDYGDDLSGRWVLVQEFRVAIA